MSKKGKKKRWKAELERDIARALRKDKTVQLSRGDFPRLVDGIWYETIEQYREFNSDGGQKFLEMESVDRPYDELRDHPEKFHGNSGSYKQREMFTTTGAPLTGSDYHPYVPKPKPVFTLQVNYFATIGTVEHMAYVVYRYHDGAYYALWISLGKGSTLQAAMGEISTLKLPELSGIVEFTTIIGRFHFRGGYISYSKAEDNFYRGVETLHRVRERIAKARDPKWIPPNLRQMSLAAFQNPEIWAIIPAHEHKRLKLWLNQGAPSWYKNKPSGVKWGCMNAYLLDDSPDWWKKFHAKKEPLALPPAPNDTIKKLPAFERQEHRQSQHSLHEMSGKVWDSLLSRWVTPKKPN